MTPARPKNRIRVVVLISGSGSNLQSLIDHMSAGDIAATIVGVFSDRADAFGLERARRVAIPAIFLDPAAYAQRSAFDAALADRVDSLSPDLIVLAGYMRILCADFVQRFAGRMLNIHPSLLPKYKGLSTYRRVLEAGDSLHGTSVHYVTEELDGGPVVAQSRTAVRPGDDEHSLSARVQAAEHKLYPRIVGWIADGSLHLQSGRVRLSGAWLAQPVIFEEDP